MNYRWRKILNSTLSSHFTRGIFTFSIAARLCTCVCTTVGQLRHQLPTKNCAECNWTCVEGWCRKDDLSCPMCSWPNFLGPEAKPAIVLPLHWWPEVCPGPLVPVESDSYDADTENQTNFFLLWSTCDVLFLLASPQNIKK